MKLCYVLPQYYKNSAENFFHIANFLSELGKQVELYVVVEHSDTTPKINNVKKIFILDDGSNSISNFGRLVRLVNIYFELYKKGVTVYFARASLTGVLPLALANRFLNFNRASIIFWSCGQDVVPLSFSPSKKNIKRIISKLLAWLAFKVINYLATGPELMVDYYHQYYKIPKHKILTLYNDISLERFYPLSVQKKAISKEVILGINKKVMLFVHTFNECRGVDLLPLIAKNIKDKKLNVIIVAIGRPGDYSDELDQKINKDNLQDYLLNLGEVANKDIAKYYQLADLFLMPSRGEGFPRVLLEAMACGCPTLSFGVGGVANILPIDTIKELLIPLDDENQFVEQSIKLINDQKLLEELSQYSHQKAKQYRTENIVDMYIDRLSDI
ncbi:glycosyltransferase family 4 protein [Candidatus Thioglobus autotrophicus]|jgi:glycosyltransferase involved in cell wall biosynthesis|uniref:glycosyltransferase family 4 protein n=1 Tax=Candidatus Thioglobus autotrophicus TaxID=1705394 RepID=UPI00299E79B4|nr:glycosyltransferase family 4 protein [Candidatus Thioglobus autotrophicus]WPE17699.1 glycosyltransferase family 4 protein [Candidatus Thioglobus autotrophicus]